MVLARDHTPLINRDTIFVEFEIAIVSKVRIIVVKDLVFQKIIIQFFRVLFLNESSMLNLSYRQDQSYMETETLRSYLLV
jgi:hypothetical protein